MKSTTGLSPKYKKNCYEAKKKKKNPIRKWAKDKNSQLRKVIQDQSITRN